MADEQEPGARRANPLRIRYVTIHTQAPPRRVRQAALSALRFTPNSLATVAGWGAEDRQ